MRVAYTDCHAGSSIELFNCSDLVSRITIDIKAGHDVLMLGDNFDLAGCPKRDLAYLKSCRNWLRNMRHQVNVEQVNTPGSLHVIDGNHERVVLHNEQIILGDDLFEHGDYTTWGARRAKKYRRGKHGAGFLKRAIFIPLLEWKESKFSNDRITKKMKRNAIKALATAGCKTLYIGHRHPGKRIDVDLGDGLTLVVLPRGRNEI